MLSLEVLQEQTVLLTSSFGVNDTSTEAEMWDAAGEIPFSVEVDAVEASSDDPSEAEIEGTVEVRLLWTDEVESAVTLDGLRLVRSGPDTDDWRLPQAEIRRAKAAAGL